MIGKHEEIIILHMLQIVVCTRMAESYKQLVLFSISLETQYAYANRCFLNEIS